jgi:hypothetical protein
VAEKPSIAKAVANHLGGQARAVSGCLPSRWYRMKADEIKRKMSGVYNGSRTTSLTTTSRDGDSRL